jgi:hypothetical protein
VDAVSGGLARALPAALATALCLGACGGTQLWEKNEKRLEQTVTDLDTAPPDTVIRRLDAILSETSVEPGEFALQRFYASYLLARLHTEATLERPFLFETTTHGSRIGGIGQRQSSREATTRPSITGHLVASIYHASVARAMYDQAARSGPKRKGVALVPDELWRLGVDNADAHLQLILTTAYARLGFRDEVAKILDRSPQLLSRDTFVSYLDQYQIPSKLRPWICEMVFWYLRSKDEDLAYRYAIMAVEGQERFGYALPADVVARIDRWIEDGASVLFVCPASQTPYSPGEPRRPISGVPHIDFVAVARPKR